MERYLNKVSEPLLDRIDLHIEVTLLPYHELIDDTTYIGKRHITEAVQY